MLTRLTLSTTRALDVRIEQTAQHVTDDSESSLTVDLDALRAFFLPLPNSSWRRAATACARTLAPACTDLQSMLCADIDNVAQIMLDLEEHADAPSEGALAAAVLAPPENETTTGPALPAHCVELRTATRSPQRRRRISHPSTPIVILSTHSSAPTIVITPSPPVSRALHVRVPCQDAAFGARLTVPTHPVFNGARADLHDADRTALARVVDWRLCGGRWEAIVPCLREQERRGLFSRPVSAKKRRRLRAGRANSMVG